MSQSRWYGASRTGQVTIQPAAPGGSPLYEAQVRKLRKGCGQPRRGGGSRWKHTGRSQEHPVPLIVRKENHINHGLYVSSPELTHGGAFTWWCVIKTFDTRPGPGSGFGNSFQSLRLWLCWRFRSRHEPPVSVRVWLKTERQVEEAEPCFY